MNVGAAVAAVEAYASRLGIAVAAEGAPTFVSVDSASDHIAGGSRITILGTNLIGTTSVTLAGIEVADLYVRSSEMIIATTAEAPESIIGDIVITTGTGSVTEEDAWEYQEFD